MKKLLSWLLALAMVVGTIASPVSYAQEQTAENGLVTKEDLDKVNPEDVTSYAKSYLKAHPEILKTLGEPKSVRSGAKKSISTPSKQSKSEGPARVIVVLKRKPVVDTATARGVKLPTLPSGEVSSMESTMIAEQNAVKAELEAAGVKFQSTDAKAALPANSHYTRLLNGFSAYVSPEDIPLIEANEKVQEVIFQNTYRAPKTPSMFTSNSMVFSEEAHKLGYSGQGMVVAVIDSGIDSNHPDLQKLSDGTRPKYTEQSMNAAIAQYHLPGCYLNEKIPYAYNYYDHSSLSKDIGKDSQHGQHVAGTVAANGKIHGVAPEAQILAMKVFSDDIRYSTTFSDIYLKAIEDAISLGADAINMSLGSPAGQYYPGSPEDLAVAKARENGVVMAISAGNESNIMDGADAVADVLTFNNKLPLEKNPDTGVVGSPAVNKDSFSVASAENTHKMVNKLNYFVDGKAASCAILPSDGSPDGSKVLPGKQEIVVVGKDPKPGKPEDWAGVDVKGKIALVKRGNTFTDTLAEAVKAGAAGLLLYNHESGGEELVNMVGGDTAPIPYAFIGNEAGAKLAQAKDAKIEYTKEQMSIKNPDAGKMSSFSSWGPDPDLNMKPEITAPGGQIYSTQNDGKYTTMSGTSMAAPHISGAIALVKQRIQTDPLFKALHLGEAETVDMVKTLLMNTAHPLVFQSNPSNPKEGYSYTYSVRQQGAGMIDLKKAVSVNQYAVNSATKLPKVELKSFDEKKFDVSIQLTNLSDEEVTYKPSIELLKDYIDKAYDDSDVRFNYLETDWVDSQLKGDEMVKVPAKGTVTAKFTVDFSKDSIGRNQFVDGYLRFTPQVKDKDGKWVDSQSAKAGIELSVPVLGFYGDWEEPSIVDSYLQNLDQEKPKDVPTFTLTTPMQYNYEDGMCYYADPYGVNYINPGSELAIDPWTGNFGFMGTLLRNVAEINFRVVDGNNPNQVLRTLNSYYDMQKLTNMYKGKLPFVTFEKSIWDGTLAGKPIGDGRKVNYVVEFKRTKTTKNPQVHSFQVIGDNTAPVISKLSYDKDTTTLHVDAYDKLSGGQSFTVFRLDAKQLKNSNLKELLKDLETAKLTGKSDKKMVGVDHRFVPMVGGDKESGLNPALLYKEGQTGYDIDIKQLLDQEAAPIVVLAIDKAGNVAVQAIHCDPLSADQIKKMTATKPVVDPVHAKSRLVRGQAEPLATVTIKKADGSEIGKGVAGEDGKFAIKLADGVELKKGEKILVQSTNLKGSSSEVVEVEVLEPSLTETANITVKINGKSVIKGQEPADLNWDQISFELLTEDEDLVASSKKVDVKEKEALLQTFGQVPEGKYVIRAKNLSEKYSFEPELQTIEVKKGQTDPYVVTISSPENRKDMEYDQAQIKIDRPELLEAYKDSQVEFQGSTFGWKGINRLTIEDNDHKEHELPLTTKQKQSVTIDNKEVFFGEVHYFGKQAEEDKPLTVALKDGYYEMPFKTSTSDQRDFQVVRRFWVDAKKPTIRATVSQARRTDDPKATITLSMADNLNFLEFYRNDNFLGAKDTSVNGFGQKDIQYTFKDEVTLKPGDNELVYKVKDISGNIETVTVHLTYVDKEELESLIQVAEKVQQPAASLLEALKTAKTVNVDEKADREAVDAAAKALREELNKEDPTLIRPVLKGVHDQTVQVGDTLDLLKDVYAYDAFGNDITDKIVLTPSEVDTTKVGDYTVDYSVSDGQRETNKTITIHVVPKPVSTLKLEEALKTAKEEKADKYTPKSFQALTKAIQDAEALLKDPEKTQEKVDAAVQALNDAFQALVLRANTNDLAQALEKADKLAKDTTLTPKSLEQLQKAIEEAKKVLANADASQAEVDQASKNLRDAMKAVLHQADKSKLQDLYQKAQELAKNEKLTEAQKKELKDAMTQAKAVMDNPEATKAEVEKEEIALSEKLAQIAKELPQEPTVDKTSLEETLKKAKELDTSKADAALKESLEQAIKQAEILLSADSTSQEAVDAAKTRLEKLMQEIAKKAEETTDPEPNPGTDPEPNPGTDPEPNPGTDPEPNPGTDPEPNPGTDPEPNPGTDPKPNPGTEEPTTPTTKRVQIEDKDHQVLAAFDEDAFDGEVVMVVKEVEGVKLDGYRTLAYDIQFLKDGKPVQPKKAVTLTMSPKGLNADKVEVYHFADGQTKPEKLASKVVNGKIVFEGKTFSIYALAQKEEQSQTPSGTNNQNGSGQGCSSTRTTRRTTATPATGDYGVYGIGLAMVIAAVGLYLVSRKEEE